MSDPKNIPVFNPKWAKSYNPMEYASKKDKTHLGWKWWRLRKLKLASNPYCEVCGLLATEVHHIIPRQQDPSKTYQWDNLQSICSLCHKKTHGMGDAK
jgi:5-methylcytosine-specific restriction endonuclease McrA